MYRETMWAVLSLAKTYIVNRYTEALRITPFYFVAGRSFSESRVTR